MKQTKQLLAAGVLSAAVLGGGLFTLTASAHDMGGDDGLASKIASKFNLNKDEVQSVLNEHSTERQAEHQAERQANLEEKLTKAVEDGKLTEEQKAKVLEHHASQTDFRNSLKDKTPEERREAIEAHREEMKTWAEENGIDEQYLMSGGMKGGGHHREGGMRQ